MLAERMKAAFGYTELGHRQFATLAYIMIPVGYGSPVGRQGPISTQADIIAQSPIMPRATWR